MKLAALLLLLAASATAQDMPRFGTWDAAWVASSAGFVAAQIADVATSHGNIGRERNPVFGETFTSKDAAIKLGVAGGIIAAQYLVIRKFRRDRRWRGKAPRNRAEKVLTKVNIVAATVTGVTAIRNGRGQ